MLVLPKVPGGRDRMLIEAAYYGIGVAVASASGLEIIAEPAPFVPQYHKPAGWWFAEEIHRQAHAHDGVPMHS